MNKRNDAAKNLWAQMFSRTATLPRAAMYDPEAPSDRDREKRMTKALLAADWQADQIAERIEADRQWALEPNVNSPGVAPGLEARLRHLSSRVSEKLSAFGEVAHRNIEIAIDPKIGIEASLINVIMTDEAILTVSSFLFRWCGLIARAYTRTLQSNALYWTRHFVSVDDDKAFLTKRPDISLYWAQIFTSFAGTGTHATVPYKPCAPHEVIFMEQVAWAMEYFTVAHEYGHHMRNHRSVEADPIEQEFEADRFALRICDRLSMEPFGFVDNPYLTTGAGGTLMLKSLAILRRIDESSMGNADSSTHPPTDARVHRILNRNLLQPERLLIDQDFNGTVVRIMNAVDAFLQYFFAKGGQELIRKLNDLH